MPAVYTHYSIAREALKRLPEQIQTTLSKHLPLYFFGAQGADFCFFYRHLDANGKNLGSFLHRHNAYQTFSVLKLFSSHDDSLYAYSLGFITHYAADVTFHPYVYALAGSSPLRHTRVEHILDAYFKNAETNFIHPDEYARFFSYNPSSKEKQELFFLYSAIAAKSGFPTLLKQDFFRSISLFNAYLPYPSAIFSKNNPRVLSAIANEEKREWRYPANPLISRNDNAEELFERAVLFSLHRIEEFSNALHYKTALPRAPFSKNFLTGI